MTNYQPMVCPQCKGEKIIWVRQYAGRISLWKAILLGEPVHRYESVSQKCGYCDGHGMIAVNVDKLVKFD